jgi:predicted DNA-binding transcriptional regulator AlpA
MRLRLLFLFMLALLSAAADERWLSMSELAERFGMPIQTLYDWKRRGYGPKAVRLGRGPRGFLRYRLSEVERFEAEAERNTAGAA